MDAAPCGPRAHRRACWPSTWPRWRNMRFLDCSNLFCAVICVCDRCLCMLQANALEHHCTVYRHMVAWHPIPHVHLSRRRSRRPHPHLPYRSLALTWMP